MEKNSKIINNFDNIIKRDQEYYLKPYLYQIIFCYNKKKTDERILKSILEKFFFFKKSEIEKKLSSVKNNKNIECGTYTKEIIDTKMREIKDQYKDNKIHLNFIIKIK